MNTCTGSDACLGVTIAPNKEFRKSNYYQVELSGIVAGLTPLLIIFQCHSLMGKKIFVAWYVYQH